ncbi:MAG: response regulator [Oscillospiraceae bacterium]|nr:response regulator [Oscillospiraceae bacterium]
MKKEKIPLIRFFVSDELPFEERILSFVTFVGALATVIALAARIAEGVSVAAVMAVVVMLVTILTAFFVSVMRLKGLKTITAAAVFGMGVVLFPLIFFTNGGVNSGIAAYFALTITLGFLLLKGRTRVFVISATSAAIFFCYFSALYRGVKVLPENGMSRAQIFVDGIQSVFVAGFFMGFVIVFQNDVYLKEKRKAETRLAGQQLMSGITKSFISKEPMDGIMKAALADMGVFMEASRIIVAVFEKNADFINPAYFWLANSEYAPKSLSLQKRFGGAIDRMFPHFSPDGGKSPGVYCGNTLTFEGGKYKAFYEFGGLRAFICAPIYADGTLWGVIGVEDYGKFREWGESDAQLVSAVTSSISNRVVRDVIEKERSAALEAAINASRAKGDFLSNMSHEIRTPMNAIVGMAAIGISAKTAEKKDDAFGKINNASRHLLGVINDILDISKIEANKLELSPVRFNFGKMLEDIVNIISFRADERRQKLRVDIDGDIPQTLIGDDQRLAQVITNLLSNAVKFTPDEGTIRLGARLIPRENGGGGDGSLRLLIDVSDTGIGMSGEQKSRLFRPFEQAEKGTARKYGGTGLGLAISKHIVELMGGEIWAESEPGRGSRFSFTVTVSSPGAKDGFTGAVGGGGSEDGGGGAVEDFSGRVILLAEDVEINREIVAALLEPTGVTVECAENGERALNMFAAAPERFDMILMDVQMPEMDGYEAAKRIRSLNVPRAGEIPIVAMTANVFREDIERCLEAGMNAHIGKPLNPGELFGTVGAYLRQEGAERL